MATPIAGRLGDLFGYRRVLLVCLAFLAVGAVIAFGLLAAGHAHLWQFCVAGVLGAGYGLAFASVGNLVVNAVEPHHTGVATGVNTIVRTVGGAVGAQLAAAILVPATESR